MLTTARISLAAVLALTAGFATSTSIGAPRHDGPDGPRMTPPPPPHAAPNSPPPPRGQRDLDRSEQGPGGPCEGAPFDPSLHPHAGGPGPDGPRFLHVLADEQSTHQWSDGPHTITVQAGPKAAAIIYNGEEIFSISLDGTSEGAFSNGSVKINVSVEDGALSAQFNGEEVLKISSEDLKAAGAEATALVDRLNRGVHSWTVEGGRGDPEQFRREARRLAERLHQSFGPGGPEGPDGPRGPRGPGGPGGPGEPFGFGGMNPPRVMIGITMEQAGEADSLPTGVDPERSTLVTRVIEDLPAAQAGLKAGDFVIKVLGKSAASPSDIRAALRERNPGDELPLTVVRADPDDPRKTEELAITLKLKAFDAGGLEGPLGQGDQGASTLSPRLADMNSRLAQLSEELSNLGAQLSSAKDAAINSDVLKKVSELAAQMGKLGGELARGYAREGADFMFFGPPGEGQQGGATIRRFSIPRVFIDRDRGGEAIIVRPDSSEAPDAPEAPPFAMPALEGMRRLEERLDRLEKLLERLDEKTGASPSDDR